MSRRRGPARSSKAPRNASSRRGPTPARRVAPASAPAPPASALRTAVAARSRVPLAFLSQLSPVAVSLAVLALMLAGVLAPVAYALPCLAVVLVFLTWIAYLGWPVSSGGRRWMRVAACAFVAGIMVVRVLR